MTLDEFWLTIEGLAPENATKELEARLEKLTPREIWEFAVHFSEVFQQAYDRLLWAAAYLIDDGCSDDGFMDFRYGLISRGRTFFESALKDPDSLAETLSDGDWIRNESFGYVASLVYERKTGDEMPDPGLPLMDKPKGDWDFNDDTLCAQRLPKVWKRYRRA